MELQVLEAAQSEFEKLGASLVALSTKTGSNSRKSARQNKLTFQILFDAKGAVSAFGLRFQLPDSLIELYKSLKNDLPAFNGGTSWTLPMPAPATSSARTARSYTPKSIPIARAARNRKTYCRCCAGRPRAAPREEHRIIASRR
jgi:hypothetical protein